MDTEIYGFGRLTDVLALMAEELAEDIPPPEVIKSPPLLDTERWTRLVFPLRHIGLRLLPHMP